MSKLKTFLQGLKGKKIHVIGFSGTEGAAIALFLARKGVKNLHFHDFCEEKKFKKHFREAHVGFSAKEREELFKELGKISANFYFKENYLKDVEKADIIFVPQSWYLYEFNKPLWGLKKKRGITFSSITKLYFDLVPAKIVGITGSNGKTTTSNMINGIFQASRFQTYFSGNDRRNVQILEKIEKMTAEDFLVLEISNRQLKVDLKRSPNIGILTNITPNHLFEYSSFAEYEDSKEGMLKYQKKRDFAILNFDNPSSQKIIRKGKYNVFPFSTEEILERGAFVRGGVMVVKDAGKEYKICKTGELKIKGKHNISNALAAIATAYLAEVKIEVIRDAIKKFRGLPQRLELVRKIKGVEFYNDTASTAPESTIAALDTLKSNVILIAGGRNKGVEIEPLAKKLPDKVKDLILLESPLGEEINRL
ncbi:MAG TPA: UDP-N-acetylmuramoyl-L-alanine--D-glutamate ligase, partial [Candidatus Peregrinibacteria bacterium]|nr:UDP-N-acetylmuramoyl-L-alanine--D-glutamate ligase [Candidatus Peregrinibacteria bacterium]